MEPKLSLSSKHIKPINTAFQPHLSRSLQIKDVRKQQSQNQMSGYCFNEGSHKSAEKNRLSGLKESLLDTSLKRGSDTETASQATSFLSQRSRLDRTFGPMEKGSIRGSTFQLSTAALGSGVLSLPYVLKENGFVLGSAMIIIGALAALWSLRILLDLADQTRSASYSKLVRRVFGHKIDKMLSILLFCGISGSCITYQVIVTKLLQFIAISLGNGSSAVYTPQVVYMITLPIALLVLLPLSLVEKMSGFRYASIISILALLYILVILVIELPAYAQEYFSFDRLVYANWEIKAFSGASITFFAFSCHVEVFPIFEELQNPTQKRVDKILNRSVCINLLFYLIIGLAGYFSTYELTQKIVIEREPLGDQPFDIYMLLGMLLIIIVLCVAYPVNFNPLRTIILYKTFKSKHITIAQNLAITLFFITWTTILSILFPDVTTILSILGGVCSVTICYLIPTYLKVKLSKKQWYSKENIPAVLFFGTLVAVGYTSVGITIKESIAGI